MSWRRWRSVWLFVAAFAAGGADLSGCSSQALPRGTGGAVGSGSGAGGQPFSLGGTGAGGTGVGGTGSGGTGVGGAGIGGSGTGGSGMGGTGAGGSGLGGAIDAGSTSPGSCTPNHVNPDFAAGGACAPDCQTVSCGRPCTEDCCVTCGIDLLGSKVCTCMTPGFPYNNCVCSPPANLPAGLQGGPCSPQGYAATTPPIGAILPSLRGQPCRALNLVCFTFESTPSSERGCICMADGLMHCGSVNHWFLNNGGPTAWMP